MENDKVWLIPVLSIIGIIYIAFVAILWHSDLFVSTGNDESIKVIVAGFALVGGLFGSIVSMLGILLKHSYDKRSLNIKIQEDKRLKLEAAIQAIKLLGTESGQNVSIVQRSGVLVSLVHLGQLDIAITILSQLLLNRKIDAETAALVFNEGIKSNEGDIQQRSATLLALTADRLLLPNNTATFPECVLNSWPTQLPVTVRWEVTYAIIKLSVSRHFKAWDQGVLSTLVVTLISAWKTEPHLMLKNIVGLFLQKILPHFPEGYSFHPTTGKIEISKLEAEINAKLEKEDVFVTDRCKLALKAIDSAWK